LSISGQTHASTSQGGQFDNSLSQELEDGSFSDVCHNIVKVVSGSNWLSLCGSTTTLAVKTKFMINNRTDARKTDINSLITIIVIEINNKKNNKIVNWEDINETMNT